LQKLSGRRRLEAVNREQEKPMPFVQIKGVGGYLTIEQKQEMIRRLTDAVLSVGANASGRSHG
jgi:hypothetical protein